MTTLAQTEMLEDYLQAYSVAKQEGNQLPQVLVPVSEFRAIQQEKVRFYFY